MSDPVAIVGAGVLSPLGDEPAALYAALLAGQSGFHPIELFATDDLPCHLGGEIRGFDATRYLGQKNLRPVDRTARLFLAAAGRALETSGFTPEALADRPVGLALGTTFCSVRTIAEFDRRGLTLGPGLVSPMDFANCVINAAAGQTAIWYHLSGVNSTVSAGEASGLAAVLYAADLISRDGRPGGTQVMLAGGVEELCLESYLAHCRAGRLAGSSDDIPSERARPFDRRSQGFTLAEGAGLVVLENSRSAESRGVAPLGWLLGGATAFAALGTESSRAATMARVVRQVLHRAHVEPPELGCWFASANGSPVCDRAEAAGVAEALGDSARTLPTTAIKSMLGEALGASGGICLVALLSALNHGQVPGTVGLEETHEGFAFALAGSETRDLRWTGSRRIGLATALSTDGHCVAVLVEGVLCRP